MEQRIEEKKLTFLRFANLNTNHSFDRWLCSVYTTYRKFIQILEIKKKNILE